MPTAIQGLRGTGEFDVDHRPKNYRELFTLIEPNGSAPLNALLAMGASEEADDPEFKNFRDVMPDRTMVAGAANASTSNGTVTLTAGTENKFAVAGAIIVNGNTGEVMQATADTTGTTLTVTRNIGGTSYTIANNDVLFVAGYAAQENGVTPTAVSFDAVVASNYTQIFRTAFGLSNTLKATKLRTGSKEQEITTKALKMHMSDIERAMFFGRKLESNGTTSTPTRYTGGILSSISNVIDGNVDYTSGKITEQNFDELLIKTIFKYGSKQKIAFCGWKTAALIQQIGKARWQPTQLSGTYGINLTGYQTFAGELAIHLHPQFRQVPGMDNAMVIVDFPYLKYRYLSGRDTNLYENRQGNNQDGVLNEYLTECGLELTADKVHAYVKNWTSI